MLCATTEGAAFSLTCFIDVGGFKLGEKEVLKNYYNLEETVVGIQNKFYFFVTISIIQLALAPVSPVLGLSPSPRNSFTINSSKGN